jgi:hypothetical protein
LTEIHKSKYCANFEEFIKSAQLSGIIKLISDKALLLKPYEITDPNFSFLRKSIEKSNTIMKLKVPKKVWQGFKDFTQYLLFVEKLDIIQINGNYVKLLEKKKVDFRVLIKFFNKQGNRACKFEELRKRSELQGLYTSNGMKSKELIAVAVSDGVLLQNGELYSLTGKFVDCVIVRSSKVDEEEVLEIFEADTMLVENESNGSFNDGNYMHSHEHDQDPDRAEYASPVDDLFFGYKVNAVSYDHDQEPEADEYASPDEDLGNEVNSVSYEHDQEAEPTEYVSPGEDVFVGYEVKSVSYEHPEADEYASPDEDLGNEVNSVSYEHDQEAEPAEYVFPDEDVFVGYEVKSVSYEQPEADEFASLDEDLFVGYEVLPNEYASPVEDVFVGYDVKSVSEETYDFEEFRRDRVVASAEAQVVPNEILDHDQLVSLFTTSAKDGMNQPSSILSELGQLSIQLDTELR